MADEYRKNVSRKRAAASAKGLVVRRQNADARARVMIDLIEEGYPASVVGEYLGIAASSVTSAIARYKARSGNDA